MAETIPTSEPPSPPAPDRGSPVEIFAWALLIVSLIVGFTMTALAPT